jgi:SAM-dependent methyltransferase
MYVFEPGAIDRERLNLVTDRLNQDTLAACGRAGLRPGDRVLDVGCGPGGALLLLADLVGPAGLVVGLDISPDALAAAGDMLAANGGASQVRLLQMDVNLVAQNALAEFGHFDVALCRLVLTHQADPAATLCAVAGVLRPGGRIIALDPLRSTCFPRLDPPLPAVERIIELDIAHLQRRGLAWDVAWEYGDLCERVGLRLLDWRGELPLALHDKQGLQFARRLLQAQQRGLIEAGLTTQDEIERLVAEVDSALQRGVRRSASIILVTMIAEVRD